MNAKATELTAKVIVCCISTSVYVQPCVLNKITCKIYKSLSALEKYTV